MQRFERNADAYRSGAYKETQTRREFIDPFFKALGWDIDNEAGYAEAYKDVVHEDAIKVGGLTKAPDYCFRVGGTRKFFVEAKKPSVNVKGDLPAAFQLRRYAWSAKLPLSVLTDFEEFAVYDCRVRPDKKDGAATARTIYVPYARYDAEWDAIAGTFSKEAVLQGSFDRYAETAKGKKGTAEVDAAFLKEIESWRDELARNIALRNPSLSQRELNYCVQTTIDRIIFLRICEDRGIEDYGHLQGLLNGTNVCGRLLDLYRQADQRYNSGLFHFERERGRPEAPDELTPTLAIDDKALKHILRRLYYPDSPYEFSVLPADILGQVYEQFLGKVIRLTAGHRAVVEDKPEVKKAGGVYYTPTYIVDYIVANTVGKLLEGSTPKKAAAPRILDPACGSGSFLIGAFQFLMDWHRDWYLDDGPAKHRKELFQGPGGEWRLTTTEKKRILLNSIYGVDIDAQAVETTKLSLLLKVLEGETAETINAQLSFLHERALPDLAANIKSGNSVIGLDFVQRQTPLSLDDEDLEGLGLFDWDAEFGGILSAGGFDAVVGNPPYVRVHRLSADAKEYFWRTYVSFAEKGDLYACFIERGLRVLRPGGFISFITPNTWSSLQSFRHLRELVLGESDIVQLVRTPERVFRNATVRTMVFVLQRRVGKKPADKHVVLDMQNDGVVTVSGTVSRSAIETAHQLNFLLMADDSSDQADVGTTVGGEVEFAYGFKTGDDSLFLSSRQVEPSWRPYCRSADVQRLRRLVPSGWVDYRPDAMRKHRSTARPGDLERFERPKVVVARMGHDLVATFDDHGLLVKDAMLLLGHDDETAELRILAGLLSSRTVGDLYARQFVTIDVLKNALLSLPLPGRLHDLVEMPEGQEIIGIVNQLVQGDVSDTARHARLARLDYVVAELYGKTRARVSCSTRYELA
jgi:SAM-dependent methyltransferase